MITEKRHSNRVEFQGTVQVRDLRMALESFPATQPPTFQLKGINISLDGICLKTDRFFIPDRLFQLDFEYMNKAIHALARVDWSEKYSCGLQFIQIEDIVGILLEEEARDIQEA